MRGRRLVGQWAVSVLLVMLSACGAQTVCDLAGPLCEEAPKPGHCLRASDCMAPLVCDQDASHSTFHTCTAPDTVDGGADSGSADDGGSDSSPVQRCENNSGCANEATPVCSAAKQCVKCAADPDCAGRADGKTYCEGSGRCVACIKSLDCPATAPICSGGSCSACNAAGIDPAECGQRNPAIAVCAANGSCVECTSSLQCKEVEKPVCDKNACRGCAADGECEDKPATAPGICMDHEDRRCASEAETVRVANGDLQAAITQAIAGGKKLVLVTMGTERGVFSGPGSLSIIGKGPQRPIISGGATRPGISVTGGSLFLRGVALTSSAPGLAVSGGSAQVVASTIRDNPGGGIYVEGARLVVSRVLVTKNGPVDDGGAIWGGVRIKSPAEGTKLERLSVIDNNAPGVSCSTAVAAMGVLVTGNSATNIAGFCNFMSCAAGPMCGAGD